MDSKVNRTSQSEMRNGGETKIERDRTNRQTHTRHERRRGQPRQANQGNMRHVKVDTMNALFNERDTVELVRIANLRNRGGETYQDKDEILAVFAVEP